MVRTPPGDADELTRKISGGESTAPCSRTPMPRNIWTTKELGMGVWRHLLAVLFPGALPFGVQRLHRGVDDVRGAHARLITLDEKIPPPVPSSGHLLRVYGVPQQESQLQNRQAGPPVPGPRSRRPRLAWSAGARNPASTRQRLSCRSFAAASLGDPSGHGAPVT